MYQGFKKKNLARSIYAPVILSSNLPQADN